MLAGTLKANRKASTAGADRVSVATAGASTRACGAELQPAMSAASAATKVAHAWLVDAKRLAGRATHPMRTSRLATVSL
jgi:hypothetical protein